METVICYGKKTLICPSTLGTTWKGWRHLSPHVDDDAFVITPFGSEKTSCCRFQPSPINHRKCSVFLKP